MNLKLIFDIGMANGADTAYYLHRGFIVVAVEALPEMVAAGELRFAKEIASGQLTILSAGISDHCGKQTFWVADSSTNHSSFDKAMATRSNPGCHPIEVSCIRFRDLLDTFGTPFYVKIDIEGNDELCLRDLNPASLPKYVSAEFKSVSSICILYNLGYRRFKIVPQYVNTMSKPIAGWTFTEGSGPFGADLPGEWKDLDTVCYEWTQIMHSGATLWYDIHACL